jgi:tetratricopeptide (TPR) repeat protein
MEIREWPEAGLMRAVLEAESGAPETARTSVPVLSRFGRGYRMSDRITYCLRGRLALRGGRTAEALEHFRAAMNQAPPYWHIDSYEDCLANGYLDMGRPEDAIAEYERILRLNPRYPLAHYRLALAYERLRRPREARQAYQQFLEVWKSADPDIPEVTSARAKLGRSHVASW